MAPTTGALVEGDVALGAHELIERGARCVGHARRRESRSGVGFAGAGLMLVQQMERIF